MRGQAMASSEEFSWASIRTLSTKAAKAVKRKTAAEIARQAPESMPA